MSVFKHLDGIVALLLRALTDRQDEALKLQAHIIVDQSEEIANLRRRVEDLNEIIHGPRK